MSSEAKPFSDLVRESIEQEISRLQEHPESVVAAFNENERVARELALFEHLGKTAHFLGERLGLESRINNDNQRPEIIDPETMKTRLIGDRPEYVLDLEWQFDGKERRFKLVVADDGKQVRIIEGNNPAETVDSIQDGQLNYEGVHQKISEVLFIVLNSDFSVFRTKPEEKKSAQTAL